MYEGGFLDLEMCWGVLDDGVESEVRLGNLMLLISLASWA